MFAWFEKTAPIRLKFRVMIALQFLWGIAGVAGALWTAQGSASLGIGITVGAMIGATLSTLIAGKLICTPYVNTVIRMEGLAAGDLSSPIGHIEHKDCVGRMTAAMVVFRDNADRISAHGRDADIVVRRLGTGLEAVASGDMTYQINEPFAGEYDGLRRTFNSTVEGLERSMSQVASSAQSVHAGSTEIRAASEDLSRRTEQQAASLEETTAAMDQVTGMVGDTARGASEVRSAINAAHKDASEGGTVVSQAVDAMDAIEKSSQEIGQIISVIDGIAFQTNLLALNAGVEAARAGDAGKGFAVVANEVRALAQRSADAAKDIKDLITKSSEQVGHGVNLVGETGKMLERIVTKIADVNGLIADIANSTETQATNLKQVNHAVTDMDKMTQQNAAMVEESTAAARNLSSEADQLASLVGSFQLRSSAGRPAARPAPPAARAIPQVSGNLALKVDDEEWAEF